MNDFLKAVTVGAIAIGALVFALRKPQGEHPVTPDDYLDMLSDPYLIDLTESGIMLDSKFPFLGAVWGQFERIHEDDDRG